jgi:hypothetical protein
MNTLFDHTSYVNGMEYVLALLSIVGFVVLLEVFKKRPFMGLIESNPPWRTCASSRAWG